MVREISLVSLVPHLSFSTTWAWYIKSYVWLRPLLSLILLLVWSLLLSEVITYWFLCDVDQDLIYLSCAYPFCVSSGFYSHSEFCPKRVQGSMSLYIHTWFPHIPNLAVSKTSRLIRGHTTGERSLDRWHSHSLKWLLCLCMRVRTSVRLASLVSRHCWT